MGCDFVCSIFGSDFVEAWPAAITFRQLTN
jgi:hypothetical protein